MIRPAVLAAAAALIALPVRADAPAPESGPLCLPYGDASIFLKGTVYAIEGFEDTEADTSRRERQTDYYALVMTERICLQGVDGDPKRPPAHHVTIVRLDMPAEMAKMVVQKPVLVQGALSNGGPDADPPVTMKVGGLASQ